MPYDTSTVRVECGYFLSRYAFDEGDAVANAATALRAILARDRETRGEVKATVSGQRIIAGLTELRDQAAAGTIPLRMVRLPVSVITYKHGDERYFMVIANDGTMWETVDPIGGPWNQNKHLPQPGEDGGE